VTRDLLTEIEDLKAAQDRMPPRPVFQWRAPEDVDPCGNGPVALAGGTSGESE
jgi:hypothetical protein